MDLKQLGERLEIIRTEWDKAEFSLKLAEQVGGQVVFPAIKELRYSGRRLVDLILEFSGACDEEKIKSLLADTLFNCYRARHDAVDAAISTIAAEMSVATTTLGYGPVLSAFPDFGKLTEELTKAQELVAESRGVRTERDKLYTAIESVNLVSLIEQYRRFKACDGIMRGLAKEQRRWPLFGLIVGVFGILVAIAIAYFD